MDNIGVEITEQCIIEEYLNNWFTYEELAQYLCVGLDRIKSVLDNGNLIINLYDMKKFDKIRMHKLHIHLFYENKPDKEFLTDNERKVVEIAKFIIENKASIRDAGQRFGFGKTTIYDYMNELLPNISISLYKQVFDVLMENKSFSTNNKRVIEQVMKSYALLKEGYSSVEIQNKMGIGRNVLQRNLTTRLKKIDAEKYKEVSSILLNNQMKPLMANAFKPKH